VAQRLEDYGLIGDTHTAALVGRDGSIDWLCLPRFDSGACFAALLGDERHGRWLLAPADPRATVARRYRPGTLVLETEFACAEGRVRVVDCMARIGGAADVVRVVEGISGHVAMRMQLVIRFDYGSIVPWVQRDGTKLTAFAGPDALRLSTPVQTWGEAFTTVAEFEVAAGDRVPFVLAWHPSHEPLSDDPNAERTLRDVEAWWRDWSARGTYAGPWPDAVERSLATLKALTYAPTGGIVAAPTTSLPERLGGVRNWDYRYCWLRDAALTLHTLVACGYRDEARGFRDWLLRAVAGEPGAMQIMYGPAGERRLTEHELDWLPGYEGSAPVRIGNGAARQHQLDVFGELLDAMHEVRRAGLGPDSRAWKLPLVMLDFLESCWQEPDHGIWEVRGPQRHFTHSKVMAWVAFDRAIRAIEQARLPGPLDRWRRIRADIHAEVCREAYDSERATFTQSYGSSELDATLLLIPIVGFLPGDDTRVRGTVAAVERELAEGALVYRYRTGEAPLVDGLPGHEGAFLPCSFWLVDCLALTGRRSEARQRFGELLDLRNDLGLLAEEYDPVSGRLVGNFPQAFSHVALVDSAIRLAPRLRETTMSRIA
jgi:GH15 family glucan-1,4-alpha-glucosidase